jgi:hypothetical protein
MVGILNKMDHGLFLPIEIDIIDLPKARSFECGAFINHKRDEAVTT